MDAASFAADLDRALTIMAPVADSLWISDHFMTAERFRLECWTLLTWVAARQSDWWNMLHRPEKRRREVLDRLDAICEAEGRDPATLRRAMYLTVFLDRDAAAARARAIDRTNGEAPPFAGSPAQLVDHLGALADEGVDAFNLVFAGWPDHADLELFASEVRPAFPRSPAEPIPGGPV